MNRLAVINDEISEDFSRVLQVCSELGIRDLELRSIDGTSIVDHTAERLHEIKEMIEAGGFSVCAIASPFLKTHINEKQVPVGNVHSAQELTRDQHWDVLKRSIEIAHLLDAPIVRAFSFWRVEDPVTVREDILETLGTATEITRDGGKLLGLENEHACNIGSGIEAKWYLDRITDPTLGLIWDPGNIAALGEEPSKAQYKAVAERIIHVHVKDGNAVPATSFVTPGDGACDWESQLRWLHEGGYSGPISLETHFDIDGSKEAGTRATAIALRKLAETAGMPLG